MIVVSSEYDDEPAFSLKCKVVSKKDDTELVEEVDQKADTLFKKWMDNDQVSNHYLFDKAKRLPEKDGAEITLAHVIVSFDTLKYFRKRGRTDYPAMTMLARIQFSRLDNSGFQERVFSTSSLAMAKNQSRMEFDQLEMRTLLAQNKELIQKGII